MYMNSGYLNHLYLNDGVQNDSKALTVGCCGNYRFYNVPKFHTLRAQGRADYQLLYVAAGTAHYFFDGKEEIVTAGHMVLYKPKEIQYYEYYGKEHPEVYWVHFTGNAVEKILTHYRIPLAEHVFFTGTSLPYSQLFQQIIRELQTCDTGFEEMTCMYLRQIFLLIQRSLKTTHKVSSYLSKEINLAKDYFIKHYHESINISAYAASRNMSTCWFIRNFKQLTGTTPLQFLLSIRITNARNLLENSEYNIAEIASIVGFENPLYFSRLFKKQSGVSPLEYRKAVRELRIQKDCTHT